MPIAPRGNRIQMLSIQSFGDGSRGQKSPNHNAHMLFSEVSAVSSTKPTGEEIFFDRAMQGSGTARTLACKDPTARFSPLLLI